MRNMSNTPAPGANAAKAVVEQLQAEIRVSRYGNPKALANAMGRNYDTVRRWVVGTNPIPLHEVYAIIEALGIDEVTFFTRARGRQQQQRGPGTDPSPS